MNRKIPKHPRILAIAPSSVGFGFAVFEGQGTLVNWGVKAVGGDKNRQSILKLKEMIDHYHPELIVLEDTSVKGSKRGARTRALTKEIVALASRSKVKTMLFSRDKIRKAFFTDGQGTKQELAELIARQFPEELTHRVPPKRRAWDSEDSRINIFDAVALALMI